MKKFLSYILAAFFLYVLSVSSGAAWGTEFINVATGPTGGTYYPVGAAMATIWTEQLEGVKASAQSTGGTMNNIQLLADNEAETAFADGLYFDAYNGLKNYESKPQTFLRAMASLYPEAIHFLVAKGSGIQTLQDLKGKRVSVGAVGGSTMLTAHQLFRLAGLDPQKDVISENLGHADTVAAFSDKRIDASITIGAIGIASVVETTTLGLVDILDFSEDVITKICEETPYFAPLTLEAGTYKGQDKPVKTFSSPNILAVHEKVDADLVYNMTKALFEHKADLVAVSARMEAMKPEAISTVRIPLHPGAEKYYKELGLLP
ncbi:MAG: TAXI family TRAP transporter solute-binding subunit [Fretibacterium sp.]|nr:TAXI family TRAP transporter solute-binding subunit [Fretibacterium sp.]